MHASFGIWIAHIIVQSLFDQSVEVFQCSRFLRLLSVLLQEFTDVRIGEILVFRYTGDVSSDEGRLQEFNVDAELERCWLHGLGRECSGCELTRACEYGGRVLIVPT